MFCTSCGKKIPNNAKFCTECEKKASGATSSTIQKKNKPRYFWVLKIIKWIGYPVLFFLMFLFETVLSKKIDFSPPQADKFSSLTTETVNKNGSSFRCV